MAKKRAWDRVMFCSIRLALKTGSHICNVGIAFEVGMHNMCWSACCVLLLNSESTNINKVI